MPDQPVGMVPPRRPVLPLGGRHRIVARPATGGDGLPACDRARLLDHPHRAERRAVDASVPDRRHGWGYGDGAPPQSSGSRGRQRTRQLRLACRMGLSRLQRHRGDARSLRGRKRERPRGRHDANPRRRTPAGRGRTCGRGAGGARDDAAGADPRAVRTITWWRSAPAVPRRRSPRSGTSTRGTRFYHGITGELYWDGDTAYARATARAGAVRADAPLTRVPRELAAGSGRLLGGTLARGARRAGHGRSSHCATPEPGAPVAGRRRLGADGRVRHPLRGRPRGHGGHAPAPNRARRSS